MQSISTGNSNLDYILHGGLPRQSISIVAGPPGTGKTILAQEICFAVATPERPAIYIATVSEPQTKLIAHLQEFDYVDVDRIGTDVIFHNIENVLNEDPAALPEHIAGLIAQHRPSMIVIDSLKAISDLVPEQVQWRKLVFALAGIFSAYDLTGLWVGEYGEDTATRRPEFAIADGIMELNREMSGYSDERYFRVAKLRGSGFQDGAHALTISAAGLRFYPRLVAPTAPSRPLPLADRLSTGIGGLDEMIEAGWLRGTCTLVTGPSGAGKTVLGLHFLREGVESGEAGLLVNFQESPEQLARAVESFGWKADRLIGPGRLDVLYTSPVEMQIDTVVYELLHRIERDNVQRVVIDALGELRRSAHDERRYSEYVYVLSQEFARRRITAMLILEGPNEKARHVAEHTPEVSYMSDNMLLLSMHMVEDLSRTIRVVKTRGSDHDGKLRTLKIQRSGLVVE